MCQNCDDPEQYDARHGLSRREKFARDPDYGDWMYEQARDRELEKEQINQGVNKNGRDKAV